MKEKERELLKRISKMEGKHKAEIANMEKNSRMMQTRHEETIEEFRDIIKELNARVKQLTQCRMTN